MHSRLAAGLLAVTALTTVPLFAEDWPQFRGPTGQGISSAVDVPLHWSFAEGKSSNIGWRIDVPGKGWSSPVLARGKVYLTSAVENGASGVTLNAFCFDAASGKTLWNTQVFHPDASAVKKMHPKNTPASATPIVTDDRLFVHFGHLGSAALDLTGKVVWRQTSLQYSPVHGNGGSPLLINNELIFSCDAAKEPFVAALDAGTGEVRWKTPRHTHARKTFSFCTPLPVEVDGKTQVILPGSGFVAAYNPADGAEIWRVLYGEGYSVVPRPVFAHGLLFVSSGFDTPVTYAIRPAGASGDATASNIAWTNKKSAPNTPSMLSVGDDLYFISDNGIVSCVNAQTGKVHWTHRLDGGFSASPVLAEGRIYFQSEEGMGYVIKAGEAFESLAENDLGERSLASYAVTDHALFIRTQSHLFKIVSK